MLKEQGTEDDGHSLMPSGVCMAVKASVLGAAALQVLWGSPGPHVHGTCIHLREYHRKCVQ